MDVDLVVIFYKIFAEKYLQHYCCIVEDEADRSLSTICDGWFRDVGPPAVCEEILREDLLRWRYMLGKTGAGMRARYCWHYDEWRQSCDRLDCENSALLI